MLIQLRSASVLSLAFLAALGSTAGCDNPFAQCTEGFNCPGDGTGPSSGGSSPGGENSGGAHSGGSKSGGAGNSGGVSNVGGAHTGGAATSGGMGGEAAGGAAPKPCDGKCKGDTPLCDETTDKCVGCLKHTDCEDPTMPMCSLANECVPCLDNSSCRDTLGLGDTLPICLNGDEDEKGETKPDTGACAECGTSVDCGGDICEPDTLTCLDGLKYRKKGVCAPCEHDLECEDGQYCVSQVFGGQTIGNFCTETKESRVGLAGDCFLDADGPPFVDSKSLTSMDGKFTGLFCVLATTTCLGYSDHRQPKAGCTEATPAADAACGAEGVADGLCRQKEGSAAFLCTYPCGSGADCKTGFACPTTGDQYCGI